MDDKPSYKIKTTEWMLLRDLNIEQSNKINKDMQELILKVHEEENIEMISDDGRFVRLNR